MKKRYLIPRILKYRSLQDITLQQSQQMNMYPPCTNQGIGCSGSCTTYRDEDQPNWVGYKAWDCR